MESVPAGISYYVVLIFFANIINFVSCLDKLLSNLEFLLCRIKEAGLIFKGSTCRFYQERNYFPGHIIKNDGVDADLEILATVSEMKPPAKMTKLRASFGMVWFNLRSMAFFCKIVEPVYRLLNKSEKFIWNRECSEIVDQLILKLKKTAIFGLSIRYRTFYFDNRGFFN